MLEDNLEHVLAVSNQIVLIDRLVQKDNQVFNDDGTVLILLFPFLIDFHEYFL